MGCSSSKYVDPDAILTSNFGHYATEPPAGEKGAYILPGVVHGGLRERFAARPRVSERPPPPRRVRAAAAFSRPVKLR